ncbi:glycosyltransferase [Bacteroidia bacterium]|jgi:glycosyltransferase involved in cell wall biosynthesis|nr:glycosyltransferase [Bacteroidia bacterium]
MKISGFTIARNAQKYYFPVVESISSIYPICDEIIVALDDGEDNTRQLIEAIASEKIHIHNRVWDEKDFIESKVLAVETNYALQQCTGDWCFYIQADEVMHEDDLETIKNACLKYNDDDEVDGLLFRYKHFFGDYDHYLPVHGWYKNEIRIFKNHRNIYSIKDAQSFRKGNNEKLNVVEVDAYVYHYGWVRPPYLMQSKKKEHDGFHHDKGDVEKMYESRNQNFEYGPLGNIPTYKGSHPKVMEQFIKNISWKDELDFGKKLNVNRPLMKHEETKNKVVTWLENRFNGGRDFVGYSNWNKLKR